ncbi:putative histone-like DNA-binding protein [Breznakibacter xylanolyticus]|uniref:Putative histone-like DNA-binding protein n=1 Tax=Breznakibacter xylanolyticus TaxID=990 RepID=A0A2W7NHY2_9BACT|nr:HU family DNA-binding protein [Breznakibacter xylanolyticus]PZX12746.1 putative histone-like DNA-binding protein [Breznakibacter xylanolyticus]
MAIPYVLIPQTPPGNPHSTPKYYARAKSRREFTFRQLSQEVAQASTTVSDTDMMAALNLLTKIMKRHLENGEIIRLGDFGSFQISITSEGADSPAQFTSSLIRGGKILFRPGTDLKEMLTTLKYEKVESSIWP